jgi:glycosyltransferase involved in cell wall biosynthesis
MKTSDEEVKGSVDYSFIIPTYNRSAMLMELLQCLASLRIPDGKTWEVIVVDNNSPDDTRKLVEQVMAKYILPLRYCLETQQGAAYARNRGVVTSRGRVLAFLDDDETIVPNWLEEVNAAFDRFNCAAVGGRVRPKWLNAPPRWYTTDGPYRIIGPIQDHDLGDEVRDYTPNMPMPLGGNTAVRRECFNVYGLFRTDLGPQKEMAYAMGEDTEFGMRLLQQGERVVYVPTAVTFNPVHPSRLSKEFCRSFYFRLGRSVALLKKPSSGTKYMCGVPRHLIRSMATLAVSWARSLRPQRGPARRFYFFQLNYMFGQLFQHIYMALKGITWDDMKGTLPASTACRPEKR